MDEEFNAKITYPCAYPIKVMGLQETGFVACILAIIQRHDTTITLANLAYRESRNGKYLAINFSITATGVEQISALFEDLKASGRVAMVL
jgi:uncharacterized protein